MRPTRLAAIALLLCIAGGVLAPGGRLAAEAQGQGSQDLLTFSRAYLWAASTFSSWCRNKRLKCCECACEDDGSSGDFICISLPLGMPCPEGWESDGGSTVDNVGWNHLHTACDYEVSAPGGACTSCGTGGAAGDLYALPSFALKRIHRYREAWLHSNFGPGVFSNYDTHLQLDIKNADGSGKIALFDVTQFGRVVYSETGQGSAASDGIYQQASHAASKELTLYDGADGAGSITHDIRLARSAVLRTHGGNRVIFDIIRTSPDTNTTRYYGRFRIFRSRNDVDLVVDYQFAPTATDTELGNDRTQLWKITSVTDGYDRVATFTYTASQIGGMWAIAEVALPNGETLAYSYDGTELVGVDHPDGTQSSFTRGAAADNLVPLIYDDNAAGGTHRRKTVYLSTGTWVDPDDPMHVETQSESLVRLITNAEGEVAYLNWEDDANNERIYLYDGGGTLKVHQSVAGYPVKDEVAKSWVLEDDPATWELELTYAYNHNVTRFITKATDNLGRERAYGYDVPGAAATSITHFDGTAESWERNQFRFPTQYVDRIGRVRTATYDAQGNRLSRTIGQELDANGDPQPVPGETSTFEWTYNAEGQVATATDANGNLTQTFYSSTGDPDAIDGTGYPVKIVEAPDQPGDPQATTLQFFDGAGRMTKIIDPEGRQTTFAWDERNRLITITYFDTSTETRTYGTDQGDPATLNLLTQSSDRNGNLETREYDAHGRPTVRTIAANDPAIAVQEICTYLDGTNLEASCTLKGETTTHVYDYRLRRIQTTVQPNVSTQLTRTTFFDATRRRIGSQDHYGRRSFTAYDINDYPVRRVRETVPDALEDALALGGAVPTQQQLLDLARDLGANAAYLVSDTVYDSEFQALKQVDGRGIVDTRAYDQQGRGTTGVASAATVPANATSADIAAGTMETAITDPKLARTSVTVYDPQSNVVEVRHPRFFDPDDAEGFGRCRTTMTYTGRNLLASRTEADGSPVQATESFTYYLDRRDRTTTDFRGNTWTTHWHACCGRLQARVRPDGTGAINNTDFAGNVTHTANVPNLPTTPSDLAPEEQITNGNPPPYPWHDPTDPATVNETTTRYDARHRPTHRTEWLVPLDFVVDHARENLGTGKIPIAGEDGIPATDGLTTRWEYDDDLTDGVGLDATFADYVALLDLGAGSDGYGVAVTNPEDETTLTFYDGLRRPVLVIDGEGDARQTVYDAVVAGTPGSPGDLVVTVRVVDPDRSGHTGLKLTTSSRSDAAGRTLASLDAEAQLSTGDYDANSNRVATRDPNGVGQDCTFDLADREIICTDTQGDTTFTVYNAGSDVIQTVDGEGVAALGGPSAYSPPFIQGTLGVTTCTFDARDRKASCIDRIQGTTAYAYDPNNNLIGLTDAENGETVYLYDVRNLLVREEFPTHTPGTDPGDPGNDAREYAYDAANRKVLRDDQNGDDTVYIYDMADRLLERQYPDGLNDVFTYDAAKRLLSAESNRYANTVTRTWNEDSTLATEGLVTDGNTLTIQHGYDAANRRIACVYPNADQATAVWTDRSQLASCTYAGQHVAGFLYDPGMREISRTHDNGVTTATTYRADNLKATIQAPGVIDFTYAYDANKRKTSETDAILTDYSQNFAYDPFDRLIGWDRTGILGTGEMNRSWDLSLVGDWDQTTIDGVPQDRDHNPVHEITAIDTVPVTHDLKGNMTSNPLKLQEYIWDFDNQLQAVATTGGVPIETYRYDALGRRVSRTAGSKRTIFVCAGPQVFTEYLKNGNSTNLQFQKSYVYGMYIDEPSMVIDGKGGRFYYHCNHLYSVSALTDQAGNVVERYTYDSYGKRYVRDASGADKTSTVLEYGFTGRRLDPETGLWYFRARYLEDVLGRFISRDPLDHKEGANFYSYVKNQPSNLLDPTGEKCIVTSKRFAYRVSVAALDGYVQGTPYADARAWWHRKWQGQKLPAGVFPAMPTGGAVQVPSANPKAVFVVKLFHVDFDVCGKDCGFEVWENRAATFKQLQGKKWVKMGRSFARQGSQKVATSPPWPTTRELVPILKPIPPATHRIVFTDMPGGIQIPGVVHAIYECDQVLKVIDRATGKVVATASHTFRVGLDDAGAIVDSP